MKQRTLYNKSRHGGWSNSNTFFAYLLLKGDLEFLEEVNRLKEINALTFDTFLKIAKKYNTAEVESDNPRDIDYVNLYLFHLES